MVYIPFVTFILFYLHTVDTLCGENKLVIIERGHCVRCDNKLIIIGTLHGENKLGNKF